MFIFFKLDFIRNNMNPGEEKMCLVTIALWLCMHVWHVSSVLFKFYYYAFH
jgi:hypothetical protein